MTHKSKSARLLLGQYSNTKAHLVTLEAMEKAIVNGACDIPMNPEARPSAPSYTP